MMQDARKSRGGWRRRHARIAVIAVLAGITALGVALLFRRDRMEAVRKFEVQRAFDRVLIKESEVAEARALLARKLRELQAATADAESLDARLHAASNTAHSSR